MLRSIRTVALLILAFSFSRCGKNYNEITPQTDTYSGTFYYPTLTRTDSGKTTMKLYGNNFGITGNPNRIPAGGSGTYQASTTQILFKDVNVWTADFDYGLVLNGIYNYQIKNDSLIFSKKDSITNNIYQYRLKRVSQ